MDEIAKGVGKRGARGAVEPESVAVRKAQLHDRHPILGKRPGLVGAQDRRRSEGLDGGGASRQHPGA